MRVCPLLGFLDAEERRIGCLAHPAATGGPDLRDCGAYEADICESFLCPSLSWLSQDEAAIAEEATHDWHLYGLVVTDVPFLRAALGAVAQATGARVERRHLGRPALRAALRRLLELKTELAPGSEGLFGAFETGALAALAPPEPPARSGAASSGCPSARQCQASLAMRSSSAWARIRGAGTTSISSRARCGGASPRASRRSRSRPDQAAWAA